MFMRAESLCWSLALTLLLVSCASASDLPGAETIVLSATSASQPLLYELRDTPRAVVEIILTTPRAPASCAEENEVPVILINMEWLNDLLWVPFGESWTVSLAKAQSDVVYDWDVYVSSEVYNSENSMRLNISTNCIAPVGLQMSVIQMNVIGRYQVVIAGVILILVYALIITEWVHRTIAAMLGSGLVLIVLTFLRERPPIAEVVAWIDESTIGLLLGMMIIIGIFSTTGFFEFGAVQAFKLSKGRVWRLVAILCTLTAVLSAFLDNVTTMLLVAPVTLRLAKVVDLPPVPLLLSEIFFCNIGGTATMIGDPPNIILGSVLSEYLGFVDFIINLAPGCLLASPVCFGVIYLLFRNELADRPCEDDTIADLDREYRIHDMKLFIKVCVVLSVVILFFFLEHFTQVEPAWVALAGAAVLLLISAPHEIDAFLEKVEWSTLLFFGGLFILVEGLKLMGLIRFIGDTVALMISKADEDQRLLVAIVIILWVSAVASAFIDNIPYTATMIPVITQLAEDPKLGLPLLPLAWALSFGACLGGNGTLVGASANVVTSGISDQAGYPITFRKFFLTGMPVMIASVATVTVYMIVVFSVLGWGLHK